MSASPAPSSGAIPVVAVPPEALRDGWIGTKELPGYRAGNVVVKLDELPGVDAEHLYFDLLLLDASGHTQDNHSGPCHALGRNPTLDDRSRFVRVVAELLRHALTDAPGLPTVGQVLTFIREQGVATAKLVAAAQLLDAVCSERGVTLSLQHVLTLCLGDDEARTVLSGVVARLARTSGFGALASTLPGSEEEFDRRLRDINDGGLVEQVAYVVRTVGKSRARRLLREATDFELVPDASLFLI